MKEVNRDPCGRSKNPFCLARLTLFLVDALSHALIAVILFSAPGLSPLIPFAVLGAVIPDADIFFNKIYDSIPSLYLFTHGGITHSIAGAVILSVIAYIMVLLLAAAAIIPPGAPAAAGVYGFAAILAGALVHIAIDISAIPGIPVLAPFSERKYTLGILPGPSLLLFVAAVALVTEAALSIIPFSSAIEFFGIIAVVYLTARACMFLAVGVQLPGRKIPLIHPFRWLVIQEDTTSYQVRMYTLFHGFSEATVGEKFKNTDAREVEDAVLLPEVRRFLFFSYIVTAERAGPVLILADPLREQGFLYYPIKYRRVEVKV